MVAKTVLVGGRKFRLIPESELRALRKQAKAGASASKGRVAKTRSGRSDRRTLEELSNWMSENWDEVVKLAKANTKRLTGREVI